MPIHREENKEELVKNRLVSLTRVVAQLCETKINNRKGKSSLRVDPFWQTRIQNVIKPLELHKGTYITYMHSLLAHTE